MDSHRNPIFREPADRAPQQGQPREKVVKGLHVTQKDLDNFGYSEGKCARCDFVLKHGQDQQVTAPHSEWCRQRIMGVPQDSPWQAAHRRVGAADQHADGRAAGDKRSP